MLAAPTRVEADHLTRAEQHIADGERLVSRQLAMIERLRAEGRDAALAEKLLASLQAALEQHHEHRRLILQRLAHLEKQPS